MKEDSYYAKNREARKEYQRQYYRNNRQQVLRALELRKFLDPDYESKARSYQKDYYLRNREAILAKRRMAYKRRKQESGQ